MSKRILFIAIIVVLLCNTALFATNSSESNTLTRLFLEGPSSVTYTRQFLSAVPVPVMQQVISQLAEQVGEFVKVEGTSNPYSVIFEHGSATTYISLDGQGAIAGLQFTQIINARGSLMEAVESIIAMDATVSVLIRKNGESLVSHQADTPLAVGSAYKLGILAAVQDAIEDQSLQWGESVALEDSWKSLPTGILQSWPSGSLITIESLAALMISLSDNTAADALLSLVGRDRVDRYIPHSLPTLSTSELFRLKNPENSDLLHQYRIAGFEKRIEVLNTLKSRRMPDPSLFSGNPVAIDVEWYMTAEELADLIERLQALDLMTINAGLATKEHWLRVAYKGGSEPGVLNLTTFLIDESQNRFTVVVTLNNAEQPLDEQKAMESYQAILSYL